MKLNVMGKLMVGFGIVLLLTLGTCLYLIINMRSIDNNYSMLIEEKAKARYLTTLCLADANNTNASLRTYILSGNKSDLEKVQQSISAVEDDLKKIQPLITTEDGKKDLKSFNESFNNYKQYTIQMTSLIQERELKQGSEKELAQEKLMEFFNGNRGVGSQLNASGKALIGLISNYLEASNKQNTDETDRSILVSTVLVLLLIILGLFIAYMTGRKISIPLRCVNTELAKIASGDLTGTEIRVSNNDEIGQLAESYNKMTTSLKAIARELQEKANLVASSATELSASAENVTAGANETSSTIFEVSASVQQVAANAQDVAVLSTQTSELAIDGKEGLQSVRSQMADIQEGTNFNSEVIQGLNHSTGQITKIVDLITLIASQTNLLALNAAIEAARAGEHGRGFAVVAEEVRKLAEQSTSAAKEIYSLITAIQRNSSKAVESMERNKTQVEEGTIIVHSVGEKIEQIINAIQNVASNVESVAAASEQMTSAVQNVAAATQEQTATMEEVSATSQSLTKMADDLDVLAKKFKLD